MISSRKAWRSFIHRLLMGISLSTGLVGSAVANTMEFTVLPLTDFHVVQPLSVAIHSQSEFEMFWNSHNSDLATGKLKPKSVPQPVVDFDRYTLVVVSLGLKGNSQYSLALKSASASDAMIRVSMIEIVPGTCPILPEISDPQVFALIAKTAKPVIFDITKATLDCHPI